MEVIVVDDGSSDDTSEVAQRFERVRYYRHDANRGVSAARNTGLAVARGDLIAWLDSDDLWEMNFLEKTVSFLQSNKVDGVHTGYVHIDASGQVLSRPTQRIVPSEKLFAALIDANHIVTSSLITYKRCYEEVGNFDTQLAVCEDYDLFLRLAKRFAIVGLSDPLVRVRVHDSNTLRGLKTYTESRLALVEKHFGSIKEVRDEWSKDKRRAFGRAYMSIALRHIQGGERERGWDYVGRAATVWPEVLTRLDTFYELACDDQPRGHRGRADLLDIDKNGRDMLRRMEKLFIDGDVALLQRRSAAYGNAYLALGLLCDLGGQSQAARTHLLRAAMAYPRLILSSQLLRKLVKTFLGQRLVDRLRGRGRAFPSQRSRKRSRMDG
jgi:glycosyltransferase involved in cell wall biosynthesis